MPSSTSSSARIIPSLSSPRTLRCSSCRPFGSTAPGSATPTVAPAPKFHAPQTIWRGFALPDVDLAQLQPVCVRMLDGVEHASDAEEPEVAVDVRDADGLDPVDLAGRDDEPVRELADRHLDRDVVPQPADGDSHQNCLRTRRSFSQNMRMSGMP